MLVHSEGRYPRASPPAPGDWVGHKRLALSQELIVGDPGHAEDRVELGANLARLDTGALAFARAQGLRVVVVHPGDRLETTGALRDQSPAHWRAQLPELRQLSDALFAHQASAGTRTADLLNGTGKPLVACSALPSPLRPELTLNPEAVTLTQWAAWHGAETPGEVALFAELVRGINGPRVGGGEQLDTRAQGLLAPDLYFYGPTDHRLALDRYDRDAVLLWQGSQGQVVDDSSQAADGGARGQLFPDTNLVLIRDRALNGDRTAIHELAHGLDFLLEKQAPAWYAGWSQQLQQALHQARQRDTITDYARANAREYVAEGIAHWVLDKERLLQVDPDLARLAEQMLNKAAELAGVDPELERSHLTLLAATQKQLSRALESAQADPATAAAELSQASLQLKQSVGSLRATTQLLQFGMLSGAVDSVLQHVLRTAPPQVSPNQAAALEQAATADPVHTAFLASEQGQIGNLREEAQLAYLAGASLAHRMQAG